MKTAMSRNKITFSGQPDYTICNPILCNYLENFRDIFHNDITVTAQVTNLGDCGFSIHNISISLSDSRLVRLIDMSNYVEIDGRVIKDSKLLESLYKYIIKRSFTTFHQNDDSIRSVIHNYFSTIECTNLLCVGGECYIYPHLIKHSISYIRTDYQDIYQDAIDNRSGDSIELVDYNSFPNIDLNFETVILNVARSGLTISICDYLISNLIDRVYIVSCNDMSYARDYEILSVRYVDSKVLDHVSNGSRVTVYLLRLKS